MATAKLIAAKWTGKCSKCGGLVPKDTKVMWTPGEKGVYHVTCPANPKEVTRVAEPIAPAVAALEATRAAALAERKAVIAAAVAAKAAWVAAATAAGWCRCEGTGWLKCPAPACVNGAVLTTVKVGATVRVVKGRVMSDVWDNCSTCHGKAAVACPCGGKGKTAHAPEITGLPETAALAAANAAVEANSAAEIRAMNEMEALTTVKVGATVRVVKGRKVPIGTEGVVIWMGSGNWGPRVGVKDAAGTVHWTAESNVKVIAKSEWKEAA